MLLGRHATRGPSLARMRSARKTQRASGPPGRIQIAGLTTYIEMHEVEIGRRGRLTILRLRVLPSSSHARGRAATAERRSFG